MAGLKSFHYILISLSLLFIASLVSIASCSLRSFNSDRSKLVQQSAVHYGKHDHRKQVEQIRKEIKFIPPNGATNFTIANLIEHIYDRVWAEGEVIVQGMSSVYRKLIDNERSAIVSGYVRVDDEKETFASKLNRDIRVWDELVKDLSKIANTSSIKGLGKKINSTLSVSYNSWRFKSNIANITNLENHFETLRHYVRGSKVPTRNWPSLFQPIVDFLANSKLSIQTDVNEIGLKNVTHNLNSIISTITNQIWTTKVKQFRLMDIQKLPTNLSRDYVIMRNMTQELSTKLNSLKGLKSTLEKYVKALGVDIAPIETAIKHLPALEDYQRYLHDLVDHDRLSQPGLSRDSIVTPFDRVANQILDSWNWYTFLNGLYTKLSGYEFQGRKVKSIHMNEQNFSEFLNKLTKFNIPKLDAVQNLTLSKFQFHEVNQLLNLTLNHENFAFECQKEKENLIITRDYIKLSDLIRSDKKIRPDFCDPKRFKSVTIFASNTFFIDADLDAQMLNLTIIAPKWTIIGSNRTIVMDSPEKLFFGIANQIVNGNRLTINRYPIFVSQDDEIRIKFKNLIYPKAFQQTEYSKRITREYKMYLRNATLHLNSYAARFRRHEALQFLDRLLNGSSSTQSGSNPIWTLFQDLVDLEQISQFPHADSRETMIQYYQSLQDRLTKMFADRSFHSFLNDPTYVEFWLYLNSVNTLKLFSLKLDFEGRTTKMMIGKDFEGFREFGKKLAQRNAGVMSALKSGNKEYTLNDVKNNILVDLYIESLNLYQKIEMDTFLRESEMIQFFDLKYNNKMNPDSELSFAFTKLDSIVRSQFVQQLYYATVVPIKQLTFPYAHFYLGTYPKPTNWLQSAKSNNSSLDDLITEAIDGRFRKMFKKLEQIGNLKYEHTGVSFNFSSEPFYVWSNEQHRSTISKLLSGESVTLQSDVRSSDPHKDAIKFNTIKFNLKAKNASKQPEIDHKLANCSWTAVHMGNSFYRFDQKYYMIPSWPMSIEKNGDKSMQADFANVSQLMLSPYASWSFKLRECDLNTLKKYANEVDVELTGEGSYVESKVARMRDDYDDLHVDHYYEEYSVDLSTNDRYEQIHADTVEQFEEYLMMSRNILPMIFG